MCPCCMDKLRRAFAVASKYKAAKPARRARPERQRARPATAWAERAAGR
jgi:hypothetical protein